MTRILLADDHPIFLRGLQELLNKEPGLQVVGVAEDGRQAVSLTEKFKPDIVIMDLQMPIMNGIAATRRIHGCPTECRVIFLSMSSDPVIIRQALQSGARGYVIKDSAFDELIRAIRIVSSGERFLSPKIIGVVLDDYLDHLSKDDEGGFSLLTSREKEVLQLLAEGRTSKQIANILGVSAKTVDTHRQHVMAKLDVHNIAELTKFAIREGLTSLDF